MTLSESIFFLLFGKRRKKRIPQINQVLPIRKTPEIVSIFPHIQAIYSILNILTTSYCFLYYLCMENSYY